MESTNKSLEASIRTVFFMLANGYPSFYKNLSPEDIAAQTMLWSKMFRNHDCNSLVIAVQTYISNDTSSYPPSIGKIMDLMFRMKFQIPDFQEIWEIFRKCSSIAYYPQKCWNAMPPILRMLVSARNIADYSFMESDFQRDRFKESLEVRYNNHLQVLKEGFSSTGRELVLEQKKIFLIEPSYSVESNTLIEVEYP